MNDSVSNKNGFTAQVDFESRSKSGGRFSGLGKFRSFLRTASNIGVAAACLAVLVIGCLVLQGRLPLGSTSVSKRNSGSLSSKSCLIASEHPTRASISAPATSRATSPASFLPARIWESIRRRPKMVAVIASATAVVVIGTAVTLALLLHPPSQADVAPAAQSLVQPASPSALNIGAVVGGVITGVVLIATIAALVKRKPCAGSGQGGGPPIKKEKSKNSQTQTNKAPPLPTKTPLIRPVYAVSTGHHNEWYGPYNFNDVSLATDASSALDPEDDPMDFVVSEEEAGPGHAAGAGSQAAFMSDTEAFVPPTAATYTFLGSFSPHTSITRMDQAEAGQLDDIIAAGISNDNLSCKCEEEVSAKERAVLSGHIVNTWHHPTDSEWSNEASMEIIVQRNLISFARNYCFTGQGPLLPIYVRQFQQPEEQYLMVESVAHAILECNGQILVDSDGTTIATEIEPNKHYTCISLQDFEQQIRLGVWQNIYTALFRVLARPDFDQKFFPSQ